MNPSTLSIPSNLSPSLRRLAESELALGNSILRIEDGVWSNCPLAIVFANPLHFTEAAAANLISNEIERWESRDPHYSIEAGFRDRESRHTIAGPFA